MRWTHRVLLSALVATCSSTAVAQAPAAKPPAAETKKPAAPKKDPDRWEPAIRRFEEQDKKAPPPGGAVLFVGSSSIVGWDLKKSFPDLTAINRGFGGSQIADSVRYAGRIVTPYKPRVIVFYAGDNDIASGRPPERVAADFQAFVAKVRAALPKTRIVFIAIKPSNARWKLIDKIREANRLIRQSAAKEEGVEFVDVEPVMLGPDGKPKAELFKKDGLHLNDEGYKLWSGLVRKQVE